MSGVQTPCCRRLSTLQHSIRGASSSERAASPVRGEEAFIPRWASASEGEERNAIDRTRIAASRDSSARYGEPNGLPRRVPHQRFAASPQAICSVLCTTFGGLSLFVDSTIQVSTGRGVYFVGGCVRTRSPQERSAQLRVDLDGSTRLAMTSEVGSIPGIWQGKITGAWQWPHRAAGHVRSRDSRNS